MAKSRRNYWTPERRQLASARLREHWATGVFAQRRLPSHNRAWSAIEVAYIRKEAGHLTLGELTAGIAAMGISRTRTAVAVKMEKLRIPYGISVGLTAEQLGSLFGICSATVIKSWVPRGWISGARTSDQVQASWIFRDHHIEAFIRAHGHAFDWRKMRPGRWKSLAETLDRSDPWLTVKQAAAMLGVNRETLISHIKKGWLRAEWRYGKGIYRYVVRRSWANTFEYRRPELVGKCGKKVAA